MFTARGGDGASTAGESTRLARLEAVLFLGREPMPSRKLAQLANLTDGTEARTLVRRLNEQYDAQGRAFRVEEIAQGYHMLTRPKFAPWLRRLTGTDTTIRFSHPALETLAVVAYRQPVLRAEIETVRGVQCGEILRQLMERSMVKIVGRADELGRPMLYGTTKQFLQTFGLKHLDDLPRAELLRRDADEPDAGDEPELESETGEEQETSEMTPDQDTAVADYDDELIDDDVYEDDDLEDDDEVDEDDDLEDGEWEEVSDDDLEEEEDSDLEDDDLEDDDSWGDDEDDDWDDVEDGYEDEEED